jgi:hypothetical protein
VLTPGKPKRQRILVEEPWSFVLFEDDGEYLVTFKVAGVMAGDFSVPLSAAELALQRQDRTFVERLVKRLAGNPAQLRARQLRHAVWPGQDDMT